MNREDDFKSMDRMPAPPTDKILAVIHGELSARRRWFYRVMLVGVGGLLAAVLSLWMTEPGPLPTRLHIAFATIALIQAGWIIVFTWILTHATALLRSIESPRHGCLLSLVLYSSLLDWQFHLRVVEKVPPSQLPQ